MKTRQAREGLQPASRLQWCHTLSYATARKRGVNSVINKLYPEDRSVHEWYRFVLSFPPHLVRDYVGRFGIGAGQRVLDPFCGTGTVLVECKKLGIESVGIEANAMAHFATSVKTDWTPRPDGLAEHARHVAAMAAAQLRAEGIDDNPLSAESPRPQTSLRTLPPESMKLLLKGSISPLPLHKTLTLLECLEQNRGTEFYRHELLALAKAVVYSISNLHFGPEVGVGKPRHDAPVISTWLAGIHGVVSDLREVRHHKGVPAVAHLADSRRLLDVLEPGSIAAVITSPPYPNEKDYTRTTRLESVLLGLVRTMDDLRALKQGLLRSNTRNVYKGDDDDAWIAEYPEIMRIADEIEARRIALGKTSGFEKLYARVTKLYFGGMARHLAELRAVLRPGAKLAYVVGDQASYLQVMIPTGQLLADIGKSLGYEVMSIDLFRTRLATTTRAQLREEIVVLTWPGAAPS